MTEIATAAGLYDATAEDHVAAHRQARHEVAVSAADDLTDGGNDVGPAHDAGCAD